jgi:hypothetical protein
MTGQEIEQDRNCHYDLQSSNRLIYYHTDRGGRYAGGILIVVGGESKLLVETPFTYHCTVIGIRTSNCASIAMPFFIAGKKRHCLSVSSRIWLSRGLEVGVTSDTSTLPS